MPQADGARHILGQRLLSPCRILALRARGTNVIINVVPESLLPAPYTLQDLIERYNSDSVVTHDPEGRIDLPSHRTKPPRLLLRVELNEAAVLSSNATLSVGI